MSELQPYLRPSILPKIAQCSHYRSEANAGPAADRGTKLDVAFRLAVETKAPHNAGLDEEEREAIEWAVDTSRLLAGEHELESREEFLRTGAMGLEGTADLLCSDGCWSADLKTGQVRNYLEQQALYALGFMSSHFADEWIVYLLFCDQRELVTLRFTQESAEQIVREVLAKANGDEPPQLNDYCGWCSARFTCPVRRESLGLVEFPGLEAIESAPSNVLRDFVLRAALVEEFNDKARDVLKDRCISGSKIAGVSLTSKKGTQRAPHTLIELHARELGLGDLFAAYGSMSAAKLREIWARKIPGTPFPEDKLEQAPGSSYVTVRRPKEAK